ncbi:MAG: type IV pilus modification PilV family protein, partial [Kiritimatiellia bacterium]
TLAEILLAMMVFAIAITTILGLLARSIETADSILIKDEAINLSSAVDSYMSELPFADAYDLVTASGRASLYAFNYRMNPNTLTPHQNLDSGDTLGEDYVVVPGVFETVSDALDEAREGRLFEVKLSVSPVNPSSKTPNVDDYDQAVLVILADFYNVPSTSFVVQTDTSKDDYIPPVFSFTFAVRR